MKCQCSAPPTTVYRHWVTIQQPSGTPDASGHIDWEDSSNWSSYGQLKVNFLSRGGREGRVFDQIQVEATHIAEAPSTTASRAVDESMRLVFDSRNYNITLVDDVDESRQVVRLYLTEVK